MRQNSVNCILFPLENVWCMFKTNVGYGRLLKKPLNPWSWSLTCSRIDAFFWFSIRQTWILRVFAYNNWNPKAGIDQSSVEGHTNWLFFLATTKHPNGGSSLPGHLSSSVSIPKGFEGRTSPEVEGWTSGCKNYIHGLRFFPAPTKSKVQQQACQGQGGELAPQRVLSWLQKKIESEKSFQGWKK